jgi:pimeloyl-ACP methyl ester carboxylesterase
MHARVSARTALAVGIIAALCSHSAAAQVEAFPASFHTERIATNGTTLYVRTGGKGPAVVLVHGYGETGDMWSPLAVKLAANHTLAGRERIYLDRFWNEFSADPKKFSEASRAHYARLYAQPGAMHAGFEQFKAFDQDVIDDKAFVAKGKLTMPVLALGGEKSFGPTMAVVMRAAATNVQEGVVPNSGHWVMEENPDATIALVTEFLAE